MLEGKLMTKEEAKRILEAVLFAAGHPVTFEKLGEVLGISAEEAEALAADYAKEYESCGLPRGIQLLILGKACQLVTKEVFAPYIREALGIKRGGNLSGSSMEVLAVVAYNQPVTRSYIDVIRGVDSSYAVTSLLDKGLIEAVGRLDAPGRPMLYGTTDKFLRVFGLNSLADLPETEALDTATAAKEAEAAKSDHDSSENTPAEEATPSAAKQEKEVDL